MRIYIYVYYRPRGPCRPEEILSVNSFQSRLTKTDGTEMWWDEDEDDGVRRNKACQRGLQLCRNGVFTLIDTDSNGIGFYCYLKKRVQWADSDACSDSDAYGYCIRICTNIGTDNVEFSAIFIVTSIGFGPSVAFLHIIWNWCRIGIGQCKHTRTPWFHGCSLDKPPQHCHVFDVRSPLSVPLRDC